MNEALWVFLFFIVGVFVALRLYRWKPKGYKPFTPCPPPKHTANNILVDSYKSSKVPSKVDVIFIGSGIGSLYSAALLAKVHPSPSNALCQHLA